MKKMVVILFGLLSYTYSTGQTYSSVISDKEIYDFLNWMTVNDKKYSEEPKLKRKQIYFKILSWDTANFTIKDTTLIEEYPFFSMEGQYLYKRQSGTDTIFQQQDRDYLFRQFSGIKDSVWHHSFSQSKLLTNSKQIRPNRYFYSIPLFSLDKNYVIVQRVYYCGDVCAYGGYYVYRRIGKDGWVFVTAVNTWMS